MAVEYGTPQFFLTFTGLPLHCTILSHDVTRSFASHSNSLRSKRAGLVRPHGACDSLHHTQCPVEATRIYNNRWHTFLKTYLAKGPSPIGDITRVWFRQEDQVQQLHPCSILHALLSSPTSPADVHKVHGPHVQPPT